MCDGGVTCMGGGKAGQGGLFVGGQDLRYL